MTDLKILMLTNKIPTYRKPLYERLGENFKLTIAHFGTSNYSNFYNEKLLKIRKFRTTIFVNEKIDYSRFDVVLVWGSLKFLELYKLILKKDKKYKVIQIGKYHL